MKTVVIFGSTGYIGQNAIKVINALSGFKIVGIAAYSNIAILQQQYKSISPKMIGIVNDRAYRKCLKKLPGHKLVTSEHGLEKMIEILCPDILICSFASAIGINALLLAIRNKTRICLATKELLVSYGEIIMKAVNKFKAELLPIDSEHSALYQCLEGRNKDDVRNLILTASGGPFLKKSPKKITKKDVLNHPIWRMGAKITVDSATMMNKGLEVIEAHHLFGFPADQIKVVVHPEAIIHSMIEFIDGSVIAQLSPPDMQLPIQYALTSPQRFLSNIPPLELQKPMNFHFLPPDKRKFPCLGFAYQALKAGKTMPAVLNAANEEAVKLFLEDKLKFDDIPGVIKMVMNKHRLKDGNIEVYQQTEKWAKEMVRRFQC
ncbi:1-deoxy-D-xylulose-5-phosphate reductoisomerase [candidate division WOR-3 bacterium RBG_13_43_14]|uniref:1-deoxy-D-xylulose 5-phosphate reductoisomerase n=1 Tax=candidate division WOR-3 bacterium RBG_13_43_14 TaxID=1802590 RepID=A0A1F4UAR5_UNCW3|nr:MAG: 1-deoxy-D-xylulose-5-phosphate reductoisomerase [candidate division WOR-3 bacterium RBG_13_43_14]